MSSSTELPAEVSSANLPKLSPELERKIFEIAAYSAHCHPVNLLDFMRVAWRVWIWLEPFFYRVIFLDGSEHPAIIEGLPYFTNAALLRLIDEKRKLVLANARHLIIQDGASPSHLRRLNAIMAACIGVTHLFLYSNKRLETHELQALSGMPALRVLGIHISKLCRARELKFSHAVFRNITHLEVLDTEHDSLPWLLLGDISNLTHLAFSEMWVCPNLVDVMRRRAPLLEALIFLCNESDWRARLISLGGGGRHGTSQ
ncbi:hypothetical protein DFH06DRAFT_469198 [Mycena polygramma]|nr:hypothetical protein DFH06DRAFT_469198 [Mycena polygramma]